MDKFVIATRLYYLRHSSSACFSLFYLRIRRSQDLRIRGLSEFQQDIVAQMHDFLMYMKTSPFSSKIWILSVLNLQYGYTNIGVSSGF